MRLSTRGIATAQAIGAHKPFTTSGALSAELTPSGYVSSTGRLDAEHREMLRDDELGEGIAYVVYSYATPIAWVTRGGTVRKVSQRFSVTTTKHQSNLYML